MKGWRAGLVTGDDVIDYSSKAHFIKSQPNENQEEHNARIDAVHANDRVHDTPAKHA